MSKNYFDDWIECICVIVIELLQRRNVTLHIRIRQLKKKLNKEENE